MTFYILNVALVLAGCLVFYKVLLQKETFFPLNRFILLGCLALSFSLPLVPVPQQFSLRRPAEAVTTALPATTAQHVKQPEPKANAALQPGVQQAQQETKTAFFDNFSVLRAAIWLYWAGVIIFAINFMVQFITLLFRAYSRPVIIDGRFRIVELSGDKAPCSFGNNIFINPEKYDWDTYNQILLHEKIHIEQGHSFDILFAELALIFQWFNPFAWMYRKAVEDNLEFLTDNELLQHNNVERESYQLSLVKVSAPHFPVSLTTNYNQSILKKRLIMMNAKKSNIHTTWKYLFIIPLMAVFVSLLNEPVAFGKNNNVAKEKSPFTMPEFKDNGYWFATVKNDEISIQFKNEEKGNNYNNSTFKTSEFNNLPQGTAGTFSLTRDAGTITFNGKFDGDMGMGKYEFTPDKDFENFLKNEGVNLNRDHEMTAYFFVNLKRSYVKMLKAEGYTNMKSSDLIAMSALNVDESYIKMLKANGFTDIPFKQLVPLKALGIDDAYIKEIKSAGYPNVKFDQLITFKAQGFTGEFLKSSKEASKDVKKPVDAKQVAKADKGEKGDKGSKSDRDNETDEDRDFDNLIAMKALGVTKEFINSFTSFGYKLDTEGAIAFKSLGITPDYIKAIQALGYADVDVDEVAGLKGLGVTVDEIKGYQALNFKKLTLSDVISAKATGTTPAYILEMRKKGFNLSSVEKFVSAKVLSITGKDN